MRSLALLAVLAIAPALHAEDFALHSGDRVVFYGDSITDNGPYTYFVENFVTCRYPTLKVNYMNAGVGGDRVTGGWMGPIDQRMTRDLFSRKPTVVTVMLGMNDASYRAFDQGIFDTYRTGYQHMVDRLKKEAPQARVYLVQPSPFDDVSQAVGFPGGYNAVLVRYADYVKGLAQQNGYGVIDMNSPVVAMLQTANGFNPDLAKKIIPDRVHPTGAGHLVMADAVLKTWNASPLVSKTDIDYATGKGTVLNGTMSGWYDGSFTLKERSLPIAINRGDALTALVLQSYPIDQDWNQEMLTVRNLPAGTYTLNIDGKSVGSFSADQFGNGINLALLNTPMVQQAQKVSDLTGRIGNFRYNRWRNVEFGMADLNDSSKADAIRSMERLDAALEAQRMAAAQPVEHRFQIAKQ